MTTSRPNPHRQSSPPAGRPRVRRLPALLGAGLFLGLALFIPGPATAGVAVGVRIGPVGRPYRVVRPYRPVVVAPGYAAPRVRGHGGWYAVPRRVVVRGRGAGHGAYFQRRVYHPGHGHFHDIYRYPVYSRSRRSLRSFTSCGGVPLGPAPVAVY